MQFICNICQQAYSSSAILRRHARIHGEANLKCPKCPRIFTRKDKLTLHLRGHETDCELCGRHFPSQITLVGHLADHASTKPSDAGPSSDWGEELVPSSQAESAPELHICDECGKSYTCRKTLLRHRRTSHGSVMSATCPICPKTFKRQDMLDAHLKSHDRDQECPICRKTERSLAAMARHMRSHLVDIVTPPSPAPADPNVCTEKALRGAARNYSYTVSDGESDFQGVQGAFRDRLMNLLRSRMAEGPIKWWFASRVRFVRRSDPNDSTTAYFTSRNAMSLGEENLEEQLGNAFIKALQECEKFMREGSDWVIDQIETVELNIAQYRPLAGSTYVPLPQYIQSKRAVLNIQNQNSLCFAYSILAALHPVDRENNANRVSHYEKFLGELNFKGLDFPLPIHQIPKFERQNDISVNVLGYVEKKREIFPVYVSKLRTERVVDLLLISEGEIQHYCLIRSLSRLLGDITNHNGESFYCRYCLHRFSSQKTLDGHKTMCEDHDMQATKLPTEEDKWLEFTKIQHQLAVPFTIYADFECVLVPLATCLPDPALSRTTPTSMHVPCGYAIAVVDSDGLLHCPPIVYRGDEVVDHFVQDVLELEDELLKILTHNVPLQMTPGEEMRFVSATTCHICGKPLKGDAVRDHDHLTGKFRGAAHNACNINYQVPDHIPVVFHNLRGYDGHLLMESIGKANRELKVIANNMEKYISFSVGHLRFMDSFQFMGSSLDTLVNNLAKTGIDNFGVLKQQFPQDKLPLLVRKGVFPYEYFTSESKFGETVLPPKEAFYSSLSMENVSDVDYQHAKNVWEEFQMKTLGDYHDLYVLTDTLLLADVFQSFRAICMRTYNLDPCHFYTAPGLAWEAALKYTGVRLELLTDIDQFLFVEQGIRGGISMITTRYAKANNKYLKSFDSTKPSSYIAYYDANNLYGYAMSLPLPVDGFRWMSEGEIADLDITKVPTEGDRGYILSVDLEYPPGLHEIHSDYPLAPEKMEITDEMVSPYIKELREVLGQTPGKIQKLVPNLHDKKNYIIHHRNLQQYIQLGMRLIKINKAITFRQTPWLKSYIDLNTECRKNSKNNFEKDFFKLMNNSVFGKSMENLRNRVNIDLVNQEKKFLKRVASPAFHRFKIFYEDLVGVHMKKTSLLLNRPIYAGFTILENSKTLMYDFHYNYIKNKYGDRAILLFTDTDSLVYLIFTDDLYKDNLEDITWFDTSDYPVDHFLYSVVNKKVIGKMKDELGGVPAEESVGLRPKMYSMKMGEEDETALGTDEVGVKKTAKGINKATTRKRIRHADYVDCLFNKVRKTVEMTRIASNKHKLSTVNLRKLGLSAADDKRYVLPCGIRSLAHGHYRIPLIEESGDWDLLLGQQL